MKPTKHVLTLLLIALAQTLAAQNNTRLQIIFDDKTVTITGSDSETYRGTVTYHIDKILGSGKQLNPKTKTISKKYNLNDADATLIANYFSSSGMLAIPESDSINWSWGTDGFTYGFNYNSSTQHFKKSYWCPGSSYHKSPYNFIIYNVGCYTEELLDSKYKKQFMHTLKPGHYYTLGGFAIMTISWPSDRLY